MQIQVIPYTKSVIDDAIAIWNSVVEAGVAFPQTERDTYRFEDFAEAVLRDKAMQTCGGKTDQ